MAKIHKDEMLAIIEEALEVPKGTMSEQSEIGQVEEWDSVGHLGMLVALDKALGGAVASLQEMATAGSVARVWQILSDNGLAEGE